MRSTRTGDLGKVAAVVIIIAVLQMLIPKGGTILAWHPLVIAELLGLPILLLLHRRGQPQQSFRWAMSIYLVLLIAASVMNALLLLAGVIESSSDQPVALLFGGFTVVAINWLSFGIVYWWLDAGDPAIDRADGHHTRDLLFPQHSLDWKTFEPGIFDYMYVSFTNLLAFSPTDTQPLRTRTKLLFMLQATISTFTAVVIVGHAINSLPG